MTVVLRSCGGAFARTLLLEVTVPLKTIMEPEAGLVLEEECPN